MTCAIDRWVLGAVDWMAWFNERPADLYIRVQLIAVKEGAERPQGLQVLTERRCVGGLNCYVSIKSLLDPKAMARFAADVKRVNKAGFDVAVSDSLFVAPGTPAYAHLVTLDVDVSHGDRCADDKEKREFVRRIRDTGWYAVIDSGCKGIHVKFFLKSPVDAEYLPKLRKALAEVVGVPADPQSTNDVVHVFKLPCTLANKSGRYARPLVIKYRVLDEEAVGFYLAGLKPVIATKPATSPQEVRRGGEEKAAKEFRGVPKIIRCLIAYLQQTGELSHLARVAVADYLLAAGYSVEQVVNVFRAANDFSEKVTRTHLKSILKYLEGGGKLPRKNKILEVLEKEERKFVEECLGGEVKVDLPKPAGQPAEMPANQRPASQSAEVSAPAVQRPAKAPAPAGLTAVNTATTQSASPAPSTSQPVEVSASPTRRNAESISPPPPPHAEEKRAEKDGGSDGGSAVQKTAEKMSPAAGSNKLAEKTQKVENSAAAVETAVKVVAEVEPALAPEAEEVMKYLVTYHSVGLLRLLVDLKVYNDAARRRRVEEVLRILRERGFVELTQEGVVNLCRRWGGYASTC